MRALIAGNGMLPRLTYQHEGLAHDYRNVIVAAECIRKKGECVQIRDLTQPFSEGAQPDAQRDGPWARRPPRNSLRSVALAYSSSAIHLPSFVPN